MKNSILSGLGLIIIFFVTGCDNYSKCPIDEKPQIAADSRMIGIWKAVGDPNRFDYFLIQNSEDNHKEFVEWVGKNKGEEQDRNEAVRMIVDRFKSGEAKNTHTLYVTRMEQNGSVPLYENVNATIARVGNSTFLSIPYRNLPNEDEEIKEEKSDTGYLFIRILSFNNNGSLLKLALVNDPSLKYLSSSSQVRKQIAANMHRSSYYSDTITLYKVNGYHESKKGSITVANKWE
jgi:hypothetical protein